MKIIRKPVGVYAANCYIVYDEENKEGIVIDPGGDAEDIIFEIKELDLNIKYIVLTHAHADHIAGIEGVKEYTNAQLAVHKLDESLLKNGLKNFSSKMATGIVELNADILLENRDIISFGGLECHVIHTPGHTPGCISLKIEDSLFTGDTLFAGSIGRTDFEYGSYEEIINSIKSKLLTLPDNTKIYPGHGPSTTLKREKEYNPFIN